MIYIIYLKELKANNNNCVQYIQSGEFVMVLFGLSIFNDESEQIIK